MEKVHRTIKKYLNDPDNHNGVVPHSEPDILECEVKWVLRSTAANKAIGGDGIPAEPFKILKDDAIKVLHSICLKIWKSQQWPEDRKRSVLIPVPKKGSTKECSSHWTGALISHLSNDMLKILQARLQHYVNPELPDVQARFRKGTETRDQIANICWNIEKASEFQKNICFIDLTKLCGSQQSGKFFRRWAYQINITCLLRNWYAVQKATVRSRQGTINWFKISEGVRQGWILSPFWFNLYAEYVMQNAGLDES